MISKKKSQVTIFIIVAIVIVAAIAGYFLLKGRMNTGTLPAKFQPVENYFLDCIKQSAKEGKDVLLMSGGWIYPPEFEPGNNYAPFSSQFGFAGINIPYWYYVSSSSRVKEQVPSKTDMEEQLSRFIQENFKCDFSSFESQGYEINYSELKVKATINDLSIDLSVESEININNGVESARQTSHNVNLQTKLGKLYSQASNIYDYEQKQLFLENYALDALRLYSPVDGVEITCAPKIWIPGNVISKLNDALEANMPAIKMNGNYYTSSSKYFVNDLAVDDSVNFLYSRTWPSRFEVWPADSGLMKAEPVGNQQGLGILGFCYVPYHFVYDMYFPVLVQVYDSQELFQYPVAVIIDKNKVRNESYGSAISEGGVDLCQHKNTAMDVYTYDSGLNPVEADITFKCFQTDCNIGQTVSDGKNAMLSENFPQCVNGFVIARAEGYAEKKYMVSTNVEGTVDIILDKIYNVTVDVQMDGKEAESGVLYFNGNDYSTSLVWPQQKQVQLIQGDYNITLQVFKNSSLNFPATSQRKCVNVPTPGLMGIFGGTEEQCFDVNIPSQTITSVIAGGGKTENFFTEDVLMNGKIKIDGESLPTPASLDDLQKNYDAFETKRIYVTDVT